MNNPPKLTTIGTVLLLAATGSRAQSLDKLYLDANAGAAFQQTISIRDGTAIFTSPGGKVKFNTGFRAGTTLGYEFNQSFSAELEVGVVRNTINQVGIQPLSGLDAKAELDEIPLLVGGIYTFPLQSSFKPYIGAGIGTVIGVFDVSKPGGNYHDADFTFAYQAEAGFKYTVTKHLDLGLAYKFLGTTDHGWNDNNISLKTDGTMTHAVVGSIAWHF